MTCRKALENDIVLVWPMTNNLITVSILQVMTNFVLYYMMIAMWYHQVYMPTLPPHISKIIKGIYIANIIMERVNLFDPVLV